MLHCQMTVPKFILVFLGSLGEIAGPVACITILLRRPGEELVPWERTP